MGWSATFLRHSLDCGSPDAFRWSGFVQVAEGLRASWTKARDPAAQPKTKIPPGTGGTGP